MGAALPPAAQAPQPAPAAEPPVAAPPADRSVGAMAGELASRPVPAAPARSVSVPAADAGVPPVLGGIALGMTECQAVRRAGQPGNVDDRQPATKASARSCSPISAGRGRASITSPTAG